MSNQQSTPAPEEQKKHGDKLDDVVNDTLDRAEERSPEAGNKTDAIPPAENGQRGHERSVAAHLHENEHVHNNALKGGHFYEPMTAVNAQKQPPMDIRRVGKDHRGQ